MDTQLKTIKNLLHETFPIEDYKVTVKAIPASVKKCHYPKLVPVSAFIEVGVEVRRANDVMRRTGKPIKRHPAEESVLEVLRQAGYNAKLNHWAIGSAQQIGISE